MATEEMKSEFLGEKRQSSKEKRAKTKLQDALEKEEKKYQKSIK
jgi:hypothetical protein